MKRVLVLFVVGIVLFGGCSAQNANTAQRIIGTWFDHEGNMRYTLNMELDFEIDKITESIENIQTGETLDTLVLPITKADLKEATKKNGWLFDWKFEYDQTERQVYKLVAEKEPQTIHGLVSLEQRAKHIYMHLIENSPFNRGKDKKYLGVAGNLVAYVCKVSMGCGFDGVISFHAKTALIEHYEKALGAVHLGGGIMAIQEEDAKNLIDKYF